MDTVKKVVLASKPRYQVIIMVLLQSGMDQASFMHWNHTGLESTLKQLREKPEGPVRVEIPGRKGSKNIENFYTFIGSDACKLLSIYLKNRGNKPGHIFKTSKKAMIKYWTRQLKRLGYIEQIGSSKGNRYGLNLHRLRGVFRSRWRLSGIDVDVGEFFLGHSPDKLGYDKSPWLDPQWYEDKYLEAQPWINILSEDPLHVPRREVDALRKKLQEIEAGQDDRVLDLRAELEDMKQKVEQMKPAQEYDEAVRVLLSNPDTGKILLEALEQIRKKLEAAT